VTFDADGTTHPFDCEPTMPQLSVRLSAIEHVARCLDASTLGAMFEDVRRCAKCISTGVKRKSWCQTTWQPRISPHAIASMRGIDGPPKVHSFEAA
jgi:hypothetical protein